jgi:hypothetical protein
MPITRERSCAGRLGQDQRRLHDRKRGGAKTSSNHDDKGERVPRRDGEHD